MGVRDYKYYIQPKRSGFLLPPALCCSQTIARLRGSASRCATQRESAGPVQNRMEEQEGMASFGFRSSEEAEVPPSFLGAGGVKSAPGTVSWRNCRVTSSGLRSGCL